MSGRDRPLRRLLLCLWLLLGGGCTGRVAVPAMLGVQPGASCPTATVDALRAMDYETADDRLGCALRDLMRRGDDLPPAAALEGARLALLAGDRVADAAEREAIARLGTRWARQARAAGVDPGRAAYYLAANWGRLLRRHPLAALQHLVDLRDLLEEALAQAPDEDEGGPYRVLAMLYLRAPSWPQGIGDGDRALDLLETVDERFPDHPLNPGLRALALEELDGAAAAEEVERLRARARQALTAPRWTRHAAAWRREIFPEEGGALD